MDHAPTNRDNPYQGPSYVSGMSCWLSPLCYTLSFAYIGPRGGNFSRMHRANSKPWAARTGQVNINATGAKIQEMGPSMEQAFCELMRQVERECNAPDSDESDVADENESLVDEMGNLGIHDAKSKKKSAAASTTSSTEFAGASNHETPHHQRGQGTTYHSENLSARGPWPTPEYTPSSYMDGPFPDIQPPSVVNVDSRTYTTNINSNNTTSTNIQDSYNEGSTTTTKISKGENRGSYSMTII